MIKATDQISLARVSDGQDADKQYFFHDDAGAHVTTTPDNANSGSNLLLTSQGVKIRDGSTELAEFTNDGISFKNEERELFYMHNELDYDEQPIAKLGNGRCSLNLKSEEYDGTTFERAYFDVSPGSTGAYSYLGVWHAHDSEQNDGGFTFYSHGIHDYALHYRDGALCIDNDVRLRNKNIPEDEVYYSILWKETVQDGWYCTQSPEGMLTMRKRVSVTFGSTWTAVGGHYRNVQTLTLPFDIPYEDRIEMSGMAASSGMLAFVNSDNQSIGLNKVELMAYKENSGNASYSVNMAITITAKTNVQLGDANTEEIVNNRLSEIENGSY